MDSKTLYSKIYKCENMYFRYNVTEGVLEHLDEHKNVLDGIPVLRDNWYQNYIQYIKEFVDMIKYRG